MLSKSQTPTSRIFGLQSDIIIAGAASTSSKLQTIIANGLQSTD